MALLLKWYSMHIPEVNWIKMSFLKKKKKKMVPTTDKYYKKKWKVEWWVANEPQAILFVSFTHFVQCLSIFSQEANKFP